MSKKEEIVQPSETEVFRITPEVGKHYVTTTYTRKTGNYLNKNEKYFSTNKITYVGCFVKHEQRGFCDGAQHWDIFNNNGVEVRVDYTYEGTTCFCEVNPHA